MSQLYTRINHWQKRASLPQDLEKLWDMKFYKEKMPALSWGQNNPIYEGRLGPEQLGSDPHERKGLGIKRDSI